MESSPDNVLRSAIVTHSASTNGQSLVQTMMTPMRTNVAVVQSDLKKQFFSFPMASELLEDPSVRKTLFEVLDACETTKEAVMKVGSFSKSLNEKMTAK